MVRRIRFGEAMEVNVVVAPFGAPYGVAGGGPGAVAHNRVIAANGTVVELPGNAQTDVAPGDRFEIETPGGGGFGAVGWRRRARSTP